MCDVCAITERVVAIRVRISAIINSLNNYQFSIDALHRNLLSWAVNFTILAATSLSLRYNTFYNDPLFLRSRGEAL